jgi:CspA family cold shock protein
MKGKVKFFDATRGFGFIIPEEEGMKEIFVHWSEIEKDGFKTLENGATVAFEAVASERGMVAKKVVEL